MPSHDRHRAASNGDGARRPTDVVLDQQFDGTGLYALRAAVAAHAGDFGAPERITEDVVVIANELASNAVRHGGGAGRLLLWRNIAAVYCRVVDAGRGIAEPDRAGTHRAPAKASGGRGLWIVRQLCDDLDITSGPAGTTVTAVVRLDNSRD
jgi:anti-sigma regulatory factor (Ser/Thr protein kinase)